MESPNNSVRYVYIGCLLEHRRQVRNLTVEQMARKLEISEELIRDIERGNSAQRFRDVIAMAGALEVSVEELFDETKFQAGVLAEAERRVSRDHGP